MNMTINGCSALSKKLNIFQRYTFQVFVSGKYSIQAGGKHFMVRQQEIWKNETYSSLKFHIKARQQKIWKNKLYMLCSLVILESDRYKRI